MYAIVRMRTELSSGRRQESMTQPIRQALGVVVALLAIGLLLWGIQDILSVAVQWELARTQDLMRGAAPHTILALMIAAPISLFGIVLGIVKLRLAYGLHLLHKQIVAADRTTEGAGAVVSDVYRIGAFAALWCAVLFIALAVQSARLAMSLAPLLVDACRHLAPAHPLGTHPQTYALAWLYDMYQWTALGATAPLMFVNFVCVVVALLRVRRLLLAALRGGGDSPILPTGGDSNS